MRLRAPSMYDDHQPIPEEWELTCPACGYNLTGLVERRCPECGRRFNARQTWILNRQNSPEQLREIKLVNGLTVGLGVLYLICCLIDLKSLFAFPLPVFNELVSGYLGHEPIPGRLKALTACCVWGLVMVVG